VQSLTARWTCHIVEDASTGDAYDCGANIGPTHSLDGPKAALSQTSVGLDVALYVARKGHRCSARAKQVTEVDSDNRFPRELLHAGGTEKPVDTFLMD
jgi:hypothetical protein